MTTAEKLEDLAKSCNPWDGRGYVQPIADLRELLEEAAQAIRERDAKIASTLYVSVGKVEVVDAVNY